MKPPSIIVATIMIFLIVASFIYLGNAFGHQSTQATSTGIVAYLGTSIVYLIWLASYSKTNIEPPPTYVAELRRNLKFTFFSQLACIPLGFLLIGILISPIVFIISGILLYSSINKYTKKITQ